jgi:hypothetical protein
MTSSLLPTVALSRTVSASALPRMPFQRAVSRIASAGVVFCSARSARAASAAACR